MLRMFRTLLGPLMAVLIASAPVLASADQVGTPSTDMIKIASVSNAPVMVALPLHQARIVRLPVDVRDVIATDNTIADVIVKTPRLVYLLGNKVGSTNVLLLDASGAQIARLEIHVGVDISTLSKMLALLMPNEAIKVSSINDNVALTGTVSTSEMAANAVDIAKRFVPAANIVNLLKIRNEQQVLLKVRFSEMNRQAIKEFGIDTNWIPGAVLGGLKFGVTAGTGTTADTFGTISASSNRLNVATNALERNNLVRVLAEPTVTAISGEPASVLVGGEFPIPVPGQNGEVTIQFKQFGIQLQFTPVVQSDKRINLRINAEVSATSQQNAVTVQGFNIPSLTTRRANTSVDIPSGGSLVIAGLLQNDIQNAIQGFPGLMDIPILGTLFRSTSFQHQQTELVVVVTPYIVRPINPSDVALPTDGFVPASDVEMFFMGRLAGVYSGRKTLPAPGQLPAHVGFIVE